MTATGTRLDSNVSTFQPKNRNVPKNKNKKIKLKKKAAKDKAWTLSPELRSAAAKKHLDDLDDTVQDQLDETGNVCDITPWWVS